MNTHYLSGLSDSQKNYTVKYVYTHSTSYYNITTCCCRWWVITYKWNPPCFIQIFFMTRSHLSLQILFMTRSHFSFKFFVLLYFVARETFLSKLYTNDITRHLIFLNYDESITWSNSVMEVSETRSQVVLPCMGHRIPVKLAPV